MEKINSRELPENSLGTLDADGARIFLHPEDVKGRFRNYRSGVYFLLILVFLLVPWIYFNGEQIILLDIIERKFTFFGHHFFAHDAPFVIFLVLGVGVILLFITSIWGRVWCGWACPQTVFIDMLYRRIEKFIEGNARKRKELDRAPWTLNKLIKKIIKWFLFIVVSLHIVHSFLGYFVGTHYLFSVSFQNPSSHLSLFITMLVLTAIVLFDFAWFREQFCIIMCPYGRLQSILMDENSLVVAYDTKRGEPRRNPEVARENEGDCINCYACVKVCPTGIDIRRGTQLECIACTMCIDACDDIMRKVKKPEGLIRYSSENELKNEKRQIWRPRVFIYLATFILIISTFLYLAIGKNPIEVSITRGKIPYSTTIIDGKKVITNHFILEMGPADISASYLIKLKDEAKDNQIKTREIEVITPSNPLILKINERKKVPLMFRYKSNEGMGEIKINLEVYQLEESNNTLRVSKELTLFQ